MTNTLVLGGARSGKSRYTEALFAGRAATFVATAEPLDAEMADRIERHRAARAGGEWTVIEAPLDVAEALRRAHSRPVVVDCLTLWLSNLMMAQRDIAEETDRLLAAVRARTVDTALVANEVGWGIVPENALARRFRDEAGRLNQRVAEICDKVVLIVAGQTLAVKGGT